MKKIIKTIIVTLVLLNLCACNTKTGLLYNESADQTEEILKASAKINCKDALLHSNQGLEEDVIDLMNVEREKAGLKPLIANNTYYNNVLLRAQETEVHWSHTRPNGEKWYTVYDQSPLTGIKMIGENLGKNFTTAETIVNALMKSEDHRNNILNEKNTHVCVAITKMETEPLYIMAQHFYHMEEK